jgi:hypothetical protein
MKALLPPKCAVIYERILGKDPAFAPRVPTVEVYACIQLARCYQYDPAKNGLAIHVLQHLYRPEFAQEPQVAEGILWLGTLSFNFTQDPKKSMPHLEYVIRHFPDSPVTEKASYFYCLDAVDLKDKKVAEQACNAFLAKYPDSVWAKEVRELLKTTVPGLR